MTNLPPALPSRPSLLVTAASLVVILAGMKSAKELIVPFLLAAFIAILCLPLLCALNRRKIPQTLSVFLVVGLALTAGLTLTLFIGSSLHDFSLTLPTYQSQVREETRALFRWLNQIGIEISPQIILDYFDPSVAMKIAANTLSSLGAVLTDGFLIVLTVIFILLEATSMPQKLQQATQQPEPSLKRFSRMTDSVQSYLAIKTAVSLLTGGLVVAILLLLKVDYPLLWGVLAFLLNFIPNIGSIIAAIPAVLLALVQHGIACFALAAIGYILINVIIGNVVEPRFMGQKLGLSPLVVLISLVFWGWILGPVGMLLSVPLTMVVKIVLESTEEWHWLAILLS
ncbi:MAG: AI-2E family transporter [Desulfuromonadaceae bacterium]|nr:AI-2E family transporter [Desulfuromonadaceae bacterium]